MTTKQQKEALVYFNEHAEGWKNKALSADQRTVNIIEQRNGFVLHVIKNREKTESTLDVGCGTGDLVCDIARMGIDSTGVDFATEMIDIARARAVQDKLDRARFCCSSIFDFNPAEKRFDVISANGFIEYISLNELDRFLELTYHALNADGSLVLGSRNRLFNIFSINSFTLEEVNNKAAALLLNEATALASGATFAELAGMEVAPIQMHESQQIPLTGIKVSTRYQFTPAQMIQMLKSHGFMIEELYPIHIHGVPPVFKEQHPEVHASISNLLQKYANRISLVPYSSSFMLHATREG